MALTAAATRLLLAALLFDLWALPVLAASPEDGRRAYDAGHFADAMGIWAELSRQGSASAAFGLGLMYDLGNGTETNPEAAFFWYRKAAEAGILEAEFNVAAMYDSGRGVAQSAESAALWYAKAAAHGHHRAQFDLGLMYQQGEGVPRNPDAAKVWLRDAADGGLAAATVRLKELDRTAAKRGDGALSAVSLVAPARNVSLSIAPDSAAVELVWVPPPEPQPVHYEVKVGELGASALRIVFTETVTETATLVRLPMDAAFYVWNVETVGRDGQRVPGDWNWFSVTPPGATSVTAAQQAPSIGH